jgi:HlyD family secretion protein
MEKNSDMATSALPRQRGMKWNTWLIGGAAVVVVAAIGLAFASSRATSARAVVTVPVTRSRLVGSVTGNGSVTAEQKLDVAFQANGIVTEVLVHEGDMVRMGQVMAKLDDRILQSQVATAQASLDSARAKWVQAQKGNARPEELAAAQASVASAQAGYDAALQSAQTGDSTLASLKASFDKAQVNLQHAQAAYDRVGWRTDVGMTKESQDLQTATIDFNKAKGDYEAQLKTAAPDAQSKIQSAFKTLQQARSDLARLTTPATDTDLIIQQASVTQAEQNLRQAQLNLANASLTAPFGGVVAVVNVIAGSTVNASLPAVTLIDRDPLHVNLKLSENDVVQIKSGQPVTLTIDSLSDWKAQGQVSHIAPAAETSNGVVTYAVRVTFAGDDPRVKVGMTANLIILTAQKDNVLVVPNSALLPKGSGHVVQVVGNNGQVSEVDVQTGMTDGAQTEITLGLSEGMQVVALPGATNQRPAGMFGG